MSDIDARPYLDEMNSFASAVSRTTGHGILCACTVHADDAPFDDDRDGKAIARAAEVDHISDCD